MLMDIKDFSTLNLVYGYENGDKLLKHFAQFLKKFLKTEKIYRIEADKFGILTEKNKDEIIKLCKGINKKLSKEKFIISNNEIYITINISVAFKTNDLIKKAKLALEEIKMFKKQTVNFYDSNLEVEKFKRKVNAIKPLIMEALHKDLVIPYFQPIVDNKKLEVVKFESLARIKTDKGIIYPNDFIPIAEHLDLISEITKKMIKKTFQVASKYDYQFSINISEKDLIHSHFIDNVKEMLDKYKIYPGQIAFEVLESISAHEVEHSVNRLKELKTLGFKISLDDFGTQSSNFEKILLLNLDYVKIDGKFIKNILNDEKSLKIVKIIKKLASSIGAKTIAEYVENKEIFSILKEIGIDYSQGYYFSKPIENIEQLKGVKNG